MNYEAPEMVTCISTSTSKLYPISKKFNFKYNVPILARNIMLKLLYV